MTSSAAAVAACSTAGSFTKPDGCALFADGLTTPGIVFLDRDFRADGEVRFARATVGRQLVCTGGAFSNQNGTALDVGGLITPGDVLLNDGFRATGEVRMRGADIARDLNFTSAQLNGPKGLIAVERLMGMVLVTVAIQMLLSGVRVALAELPPVQ